MRNRGSEVLLNFSGREGFYTIPLARGRMVLLLHSSQTFVCASPLADRERAGTLADRERAGTLADRERAALWLTGRGLAPWLTGREEPREWMRG